MKSTMKKKILITTGVVVLVLAAAVVGGSLYLLNFASRHIIEARQRPSTAFMSMAHICVSGWIA